MNGTHESTSRANREERKNEPRTRRIARMGRRADIARGRSFQGAAAHRNRKKPMLGGKASRGHDPQHLETSCRKCEGIGAALGAGQHSVQKRLHEAACTASTAPNLTSFL